MSITLLLLSLIVCAMSLAASILRSVMNAGLFAMASPINFADFASPSALITALRLSWIAFSTMNLARSASCCATCLASIAAVYSRPNVSAVMDTSSRSMLNPAARLMSCDRTANETCSRWVMS